MYWDRTNKTAWAELADLASAAPHVPTLLDLFARVPPTACPPVLTMLISLSRGTDRLGKVRPADGERLRAGFGAVAQADGDTATIKKLPPPAERNEWEMKRQFAAARRFTGLSGRKVAWCRTMGRWAMSRLALISARTRIRRR